MGCLLRPAVCAHEQERLLNTGLLETARASWWHSVFLKGAGVKVGRGVYFDTTAFSVSLLLLHIFCPSGVLLS